MIAASVYSSFIAFCWFCAFFTFCFRNLCYLLNLISQIYDQMRKVDKAVGDFLWGLWYHSLDKETNVVILSDHGMSGYNNKTWGLVKDYINKTDVEFIGEAGAATMILASRNASVEKMYKSLKSWSGITVHKKKDVSMNHRCFHPCYYTITSLNKK